MGAGVDRVTKRRDEHHEGDAEARQRPRQRRIARRGAPRRGPRHHDRERAPARGDQRGPPWRRRPGGGHDRPDREGQPCRHDGDRCLGVGYGRPHAATGDQHDSGEPATAQMPRQHRPTDSRQRSDRHHADGRSGRHVIDQPPPHGTGEEHGHETGCGGCTEHRRACPEGSACRGQHGEAGCHRADGQAIERVGVVQRRGHLHPDGSGVGPGRLLRRLGLGGIAREAVQGGDQLAVFQVVGQRLDGVARQRRHRDVGDPRMAR